MDSAVTHPQDSDGDRSAHYGRGNWPRYVAIRVVSMVPTLSLIVLVAFLLIQLAPGDMVQVLAGESGGASPEYMERLRESFGLTVPFHVRFLHYIGGVLRGDLGFSFRNNMPVSQLLLARLPATLLLTGTALVLSVVFGLLGGAVAATWRGRWQDVTLSLIALIGYATPVFLSSIALIVLFGVAVPVLPIGGFVDASGVHTSWQYARSVAMHLILPAATLGMTYASIYVRVTRGAMLETQGLDFIRTARAKGLSLWRIVWRHILRNAMLPIITVVGLQGGAVLGGAILVETVFAWPGLGRLAFEAQQQRDYNLMAGLILISGTLVVVMNLVVDLLYALLDPRVRLK